MLQRLVLALVWLALLATNVLAVFADDAYSLDYHLALLGLPHRQTTFFHQPHHSSKASLLYTLSESNVLGAVNPKDGTLVWRQSLHPTSNATARFLRAGEDTDTVVTAVHGEIATWSASDGRVAWTHALGDVPVCDVELLELPTGKARSEDGKDAILLVGDIRPTVKRIDATTGRAKWEFDDTRYVYNAFFGWITANNHEVATRLCKYQHPRRASTTYPRIQHLLGDRRSK